MLRKYFNLDTRLILLLIIAIELLFNFLIKELIITDKVIYNSLAEELTIEEIDNGLSLAQTYSWAFYVAILLSVIGQIFLISVCLNIGALLLRYNLNFKEIFNVVTKAFAVFAFSKIVLLALYLYFGVNSFEDMNYMPNFSLFDALSQKNLATWIVYPLQLINIYQVAFILLLAVGMNMLRQKGVRQWLPFVLGTYGTGLIIWVVLVIFLVFL